MTAITIHQKTFIPLHSSNASARTLSGYRATVRYFRVIPEPKEFIVMPAQSRFNWVQTSFIDRPNVEGIRRIVLDHVGLWQITAIRRNRSDKGYTNKFFRIVSQPFNKSVVVLIAPGREENCSIRIQAAEKVKSTVHIRLGVSSGSA